MNGVLNLKNHWLPVRILRLDLELMIGVARIIFARFRLISESVPYQEPCRPILRPILRNGGNQSDLNRWLSLLGWDEYSRIVPAY